MSLCEDVRSAAHEIMEHEEVTIISHIDADGIAGEAILAQALSRAEIKTQSVFVRQLEPRPCISSAGRTFKLFCDSNRCRQQHLHGRTRG